MSVMRLVSVLLLVLSSACTPPNAVLGKLSSPILSAQRRQGGPLLVVLSYDTQKTPCATVEYMYATLDGALLPGSAGKRVEKMDGSFDCEFPNFSVTPEPASTSRKLVLTDDLTTITLELDTLEVGSAIADAFPATIRSGTNLRWSVVPPSVGTKSYEVGFQPTGGALTKWTDGTSLPSSLNVTVPTIPSAASGNVVLSWVTNATVKTCEGGGVTCDVMLQGGLSTSAVVSP